VSFISVDPTAAVALLCALLMLISASITQKSRDSQGRTEGEKWKLEVKSRIYFELLPKTAFSNKTLFGGYCTIRHCCNSKHLFENTTKLSLNWLRFSWGNILVKSVHQFSAQSIELSCF